MKQSHPIKSTLFGIAVGDALGVPVEFKSREYLKENPVRRMTGFGTWNKPKGTWSDDSSLAFCLAEALTQGFDLKEVAANFINWLFYGYWTADGETFDVGNATRKAIIRLENGISPAEAGGTGERSNGNGSLMRILPLVFYIKDSPVEERYELTRQVSSLTHAHIRSIRACFYYLEFARQLLEGKDKNGIYKNLQTSVLDFFEKQTVEEDELNYFDRLLKGNISSLPETEIKSSGYVIHSLEASIWCLMTTGSYKEAVLKAVSLGEDTDTIASITGGLAGLLYGFESIPKEWVQAVARRKDIEDLAERLARKIYRSP